MLYIAVLMLTFIVKLRFSKSMNIYLLLTTGNNIVIIDDIITSKTL